MWSPKHYTFPQNDVTHMKTAQDSNVIDVITHYCPQNTQFERVTAPPSPQTCEVRK